MPETSQQVTELTSLSEMQSHLPNVGEWHPQTPTWSLREDDVCANPASDFDKTSCSNANTLHESNIKFFVVSRLCTSLCEGNLPS